VKNPVDRTLKNWVPAAAAFIAALIAILWLRPFPPQARTLYAVMFIYAMAVAEVLIVVGISAATAFSAWFVMKRLDRANPPPRLIWGIASRASWVVPLYLFTTVRSGWAIVIIALLVMGLVYVLRNLQPAMKQSPALSSDAKVQLCMLAGACIEVGLIAAGTYHPTQANLLVALATFIIAWNATKGGKSGHPARGLIVVFIAIVLTSGALVRRTLVQPGDALFGVPTDPAIAASLYALQKAFGEGPAVPFVPNRAEGNERSKAEIEGLSHRGIYLWPDVKKEVTLVPPLPNLGRMAFGKDHQTPLTIPFYGVYWFFRYPFRQPPFGSLVAHGSPAVKQFLSNDCSPLWEEAHQDLKTSFDLSCCNRIEIDVTNAEQHAELVEMELLLVNNGRQGKAVQPLGKLGLVTRPQKIAVPETVQFKIPAKSKMKSFDEFVVRMRMMTPRSMDSAQVAIERFRLVPKGRR
jgi:hypothetical protein